jgi:2-polyprenyl-6-methoxyphenol hydroxylase-like FAD-dependent oxidoreductase
MRVAVVGAGIRGLTAAIALAHAGVEVSVFEAAPLARYETLRKPRATRIQDGSRQNATTYHLPDGEAQRRRDADYAAQAEAGPYAARGWLFEPDAEAEVA